MMKRRWKDLETVDEKLEWLKKANLWTDINMLIFEFLLVVALIVIMDKL
jgi:hypothetical protein